MKHGMNLTRPSMEKGRYKMVKIFHTVRAIQPVPLRNKRIQGSTANSDHDGLNSLKYTVQKLTEHRLYTLVTADVTEAMENDKLVEKST